MKKNISITLSALAIILGTVPCHAGLIDDKREIHTLETKVDDLHNKIVSLLNDLNANGKFPKMNPANYDSAMVAMVAGRIAQRKDDIARIQKQISEIASDTNKMQSSYGNYQSELEDKKSFADSLASENTAKESELSELRSALTEAKSKLADLQADPKPAPAPAPAPAPKPAQSRRLIGF